MVARQERKQETRERILASAASSLRQKGIAAPSVGEVMAGAGLTVGGFYAHFDNKDALLLETLEQLTATHLREWLASLPGESAEERRQLCARGYLSRKHRDGGLIHCPLPRLLGELERVDPRYRELIARHLDDWARALAEDASPDERRRALGAIATMVGGLALARAFGPTPFSDEILAAAKSAIG